MKNRGFFERLGFARDGFVHAWRAEPSFRTHCAVATLVQVFFLATRGGFVWWAMATLTSALVISAELINTALESALDLLHPDFHPAVKVAKDCAAAAVLGLCLASLLLLALYIFDRFWA